MMGRFNNWLYSLPCFVGLSIMYLVSFTGFGVVGVSLYVVQFFTGVPVHVVLIVFVIGVPLSVVLGYFCFNKKG
jgi:hypothetical protein